MVERGITFDVTVDLEGALLVDKDKFQRVVLNLAGNAREALAPGGVLRILVAREDKMAHITVKDNGPGIPEEIRTRLFEPFVTHGKKGGTGLGTAISKKIVEEMGGRIWFNTASGRGTTFHIQLPLAG
jgi:signal transduction histidine kinase